ncbi:MAG: hypothetical protein ACR2F6_00430 [Mycobacteriales bacterium]
MYQRTEKLIIGSGDAAGVIARIQSDLVSLIEAASGFICYSIVKIDDANILSTRLFRDLASMDSATQSTTQTTSAIATDFDLSIEVIVDSDVSIGAASVLEEEFRP